MAQQIWKINYMYHFADEDGFLGWKKERSLMVPVRQTNVRSSLHWVDGLSVVEQKPTTLSMRPNDDNKHLLLALWTPTVFPFNVVHLQGYPWFTWVFSLFAVLLFCSVSDWMLIHTPVSTSPLPDNDKNHCHYYNGMARSRVTAHGCPWLSEGPDKICHQHTFLCVSECLCMCACHPISHDSMLIKCLIGIVVTLGTW